VLSDTELKARLSSIFTADTAEHGRVEGAKYPLRIDEASVLAPGGSRLDRARCQDTSPELVLRPGDSAFVSSYEKFSMPGDLAGYISPRYRTVRDGLLVLHGSLLDPGFGSEAPSGAGLQAHVVNVSDTEIRLPIGKDGESLLAVAFTKLAHDSSTTAGLPSRRERDLAHAFVLLTRLRDVDLEFRRLKAEVGTVMVFGLFLLATAALGASAAVIVTVTGSPLFSRVVAHTHWPFTVLVIGGLLVVWLICYTLVQGWRGDGDCRSPS
jgi:deoxycytidine triphosphate deaminase